MTDEKNDSLDRLLTQHRPLPTSAPPGEFQQILARVRQTQSEPAPVRHRFRFAWLAPAVGLAAAVAVAWMMISPRSNPRDLEAERFVVGAMSEFYADEQNDAVEGDLFELGSLADLE